MVRQLFFSAVFLLLLDTSSPSQPKTPPSHGVFTGELLLKPLEDGRNMQVMKDFSYTDWQGHTLTANAGFVSDGATIPKPVWGLVGGPWDGQYRKAAVVHDVGCINHKYTWRDTHRLFLEAMLDSGVKRSLALTMYWGVLVGGPRWEAVATAEAKSSKSLESNISLEMSKLSKLQKDSAIVSTTTTEQKIENKTVKTYSATVYLPSPGKDVPVDALNNLQRELAARESKGEEISIEEIEKRAQ